DDLREVVVVELVEAAEDIRRRPRIEAPGGDGDLVEEDLARPPETDAPAGDEGVVVVRRDLGALAARRVEAADLAVDPVHRPRVDEQLPQRDVPRRVAAPDAQVVPAARQAAARRRPAGDRIASLGIQLQPQADDLPVLLLVRRRLALARLDVPVAGLERARLPVDPA